MRFRFAILLSFSFITLAFADTPSPPASPPAPKIPVNLNNRTFLETTSIYDPTYGLARVGIVKNKVVEFLPFRFLKTLPSAGTLLSRNFQTYYYNSEAKQSGNLQIPVIGGFSASGDDILHIVMEDISEVYLDKGYRPVSCEIWNSINHSLVDPGDKIIFTDHAILTTISYGVATKVGANAQVGFGSYFSAGGETYKSSDVTTKIPLIAVDGVSFTIKDPKTFCTHAGDRRLEAVSEFTTLQDLHLPPDTEFKIQGAEPPDTPNGASP